MIHQLIYIAGLSLQLCEQELAPRIDRWGCDHGAGGLVLVRQAGNGELIWRRGASQYVDRMRGLAYGKSELQFIKDLPRGSSPLPKTLIEGGRLTWSRVQEQAQRIDDLFGISGLAGRISVKNTLVIP